MFATSLLVAILACLWIGTPALAEDAYRLSNGNGFSYQGKDFTTQVVIKPNDQRGLATTQDITAYEYLDTATGKAEYIYNAAPTATTASYAAFTVTPQGIYQYIPGPTTVTLSNNPPPGQNQQQQTQQQTPDQQDQANTVTPSQQNANPSTCTVSGVGWIVCPVTSQLAGMIDGIYGVLMQFLDVKPMLQNGPIFDIWKAVKNIANICFIIAFLVLIYSQVTSLGISNYGIKKMLPRLVIAAILVNVSFWICALGVDLSNFLGHSVYQFLMSFATSLNGFDVQVSWEDLASGILGATAGAGIVAGGLLFSVATGGSLMAALFTLMGMLISVALALITALFILMARQALVIVFVIISPLAFVALVLPKTEKWFDKWKDTFVAMLIMFPLFSLVFGGAVLAGAAIIAGSGDSIFLILLGKGTQLIPLAITPLIVKFSTGLLGTIANFANNKNKGLVDRAKNWTSGQAEHHRKKSLANQDGRKYNPFRWTAQRFDDTARRQKLEQEGFENASEARAKNGGTGLGRNRRLNSYRNAYTYSRDMASDNESETSLLKGDYDKYRRTNSTGLAHELRRHQTEVYSKKEADSLERLHADTIAEGATNPNIQRALANIRDTNVRNMALAQANAIRLDSEDIAFEGMAKRLADAQHKSNVTERLNTNAELRVEIGRIRGAGGAELIHATAIAEERKQFNEFVSARQEIMKHFKVNSQDTFNLAMGRSVPKVRDDGTSLTFDANDEYTREAAIENVFQVGAAGNILDVIESTGAGGINHAYRSTALAAFQKNGKMKSLPFINDKAFDLIQNGNYNGKVTTRQQVVRRILEGRLTANDLSDAHASSIDKFFESRNSSAEWTEARNVMIGADIEKAAAYAANYRSMLASAVEVLKDPDIRKGTSTESVNTLKRHLGINVTSFDGYDWDALELRLGLR